MNKGLSIFKNRQRFQGGTPLVSNQADNVGRMSPQERLFYEYTQEMFKKRELEQQLREKLDDEQGHEEEVQNHARGTSNVPLSIFKRARHLQGGESNLRPGSINDQFELPSIDPWAKWEGGGFPISGGQDSTFYPGAAGIPPSTGGSLPPTDTTTDPTTGPGTSTTGGTTGVGDLTDVTGSGGSTMTDQQMIDRLGYDPSDPRNDLTRGFGSGVPTQRAIGMIGNFLGNAAFPGLGMLTGAAAAKITQMIQNGAGMDAVKNAISAYQGGGGTGTTDTQDTTGTGDGATTTAPPTTPTTPNAGVGIDPTGNPAGPGQWWSPDFGRWSGYDKFGTTPGSYNLIGPGGAVGTRGTGFGAGTVGNLATAIGLDTVGRGGGGANFGSGYGNVAGLQLRHIAKGLFGNDPNPEGMGALYEMTGTQSPSAGQYQQSQQQLQNILQSNPSLMSAPTSGPMLRGGSRIPLQTVQTGSSDIQQNPGLRLFMAGQGLRKPKPRKNQKP